MSEETVIKIETPEPEVINETHAIINPPTIVEPESIDETALMIGETRGELKGLKTQLESIKNDFDGFVSEVKEQFTKLVILMTPEPEPEPIIEETPPEELPVETLPEIEIIPEVIPEDVENKVVKRNRFFV